MKTNKLKNMKVKHKTQEDFSIHFPWQKKNIYKVHGVRF